MNDVAFSPDGERLVMVLGKEGTLVVVDGLSRQLGSLEVGAGAGGQPPCRLVARQPGPRITSVSRAKFTPDGRRLVTLGTERDVNFWDAATWEKVTTVTVHRGRVNDVAVNPDGTWIATAGEDGSFLLSPLGADALLREGCRRVTRALARTECRDNLGADRCPAHPCPVP